MAPLLPKLRGHFAEFLNHDSLDLLSILYLTTCVGLGYGQLEPRVDAFLGSIGSSDHTLYGFPFNSQPSRETDLPISRPTVLAWDYHRPGPTTFLRHTC